MSHEYTIRGFLRRVPMSALHSYFEGRHELPDFDWSHAGDGAVETLFEAIQALRPQEVEEIDGDFREIHGLATGDGMRMLIEEARARGIDLRDPLAKMDTLPRKALWVFAEHPDVFRFAAMIEHADRFNGRHRFRRNGLPQERPDLGPEAIRRLAQAVGEYYWAREGRGKFCQVDPYTRGDHDHYLFAYLQDHADTYPAFDDQGRFHRQRERRAFEVIFHFDHRAGVLDLCARGDQARRKDLQEIFARTILGLQQVPPAPPSAPYDLSRLAQRDFAFRTPSEAGDVDVAVKRLRLAVRSQRSKKLTLEADTRRPGDLYDLLDRVLHERALLPSDVEVDRADIHVRLACFHGKPKSFTFGVSPRACNLKDAPEEQVALECLRLSEITVA